MGETRLVGDREVREERGRRRSIKVK